MNLQLSDKRPLPLLTGKNYFSWGRSARHAVLSARRLPKRHCIRLSRGVARLGTSQKWFFPAISRFLCGVSNRSLGRMRWCRADMTQRNIGGWLVFAGQI